MVRPQVVTGLQLPLVVAARGVQETSWMSQPLFRQLHQLTDTASPSSSAQTAEDDSSTQDLYTTILQIIREEKEESPVSAVTSLLVSAIATKLSRFLPVPCDDFDTTRPLHSHGIDSLIAMEVCSWFLRVLKCEISVFGILGGASTQALARTVAGKMVGEKT